MSHAQQPPTEDVSTRQRDPLAACGAGEVLRCEHPETGWVWYYAREHGVVRKYHAYHGFDPQIVSRTEMAETVGREGVVSRAVGEGQLDVLRGRA
ncbi:hypothetical protein A6E15_19200 [Natrinema saccharevitans]|uniref:Uncharacterized protein n=1 Tax=Natrinema saccharevitans TaxID=301967 RepID=A0A1S8AR08_9EURY|nr:hypothetical protein [Natrinema saccharevitans]OLZ39092.1 hypothetical protein A6E15_19200 [Natrinema saccharevitans]